MSLFLAFLLAGCLNMKTVTLVPVDDLGTSPWAQVPNDGLAHYLKVDEGVSTPDDAGTYLKSVPGLDLEQLGVAAMPADFKHSVEVRLRARARSSSAGSALGFLFLVNGVDVYSGNPPTNPGEFFDWSVLPLNIFSDLSFALPFPFPALSGDESIAIVFATSDSGIDITAVELEIDYVPRTLHAQGSGDGPFGHGHDVAPSASGDSGSPAGSGVSAAPDGSAASGGKAAGSTSAAPSASLSMPGRHAGGLALPITATPSPGGPRATATSGAVRATASGPSSHGERD